jgi:cytochrome c biogenesis protein CcmG/thiol:disulfide interchange protein DsbE
VKPFTFIVPVLLFAAVAVALFLSLNLASQTSAPSGLIDRPLPDVNLEAIAGEGAPFRVADVQAGRVSLVNIWASWCAPCRLEAPQLRSLAARKDVDLYGVAFKDTPDHARAFLDEAGRPYARIALDRVGRIAGLWNVQGAPVTLVVDGQGIVRARFDGPITDRSLRDGVLPAIARVAAE